MPRLWRSLPSAVASAALLLGLLLGLAGCSPDPEDDVVRSLDIAIEIDEQGTLHVTETYAWDFGTREGLGFRRDLIRREPADGDDGRLRVYEYGDFEASSSSGAPAEVWTEEDGDMLRVGVGSTEERGETRTGVQGYELSYTVDGAMTATTTTTGSSGGSDGPGQPASVSTQQQLDWNVTGQQWQVPLEHVDTTITAPADPLRTSCQAGDVETIRSCRIVEGEGNVRMTAADLASGQGLTVQATYPSGTVADAAPQLVTPHWTSPHRFWPAVATVTDPVWTVVRVSSVPLIAVVAVVCGIWMMRRIRRDRDDAFVGLAPGTLPTRATADTTPTTPARRRPDAPPRPTPPERLSPAEAALLIERTLPPRAIGATLLDLAARGHVELTPLQPRGAAAGPETDVEQAPVAESPASERTPESDEAAPSTWLARRTTPRRHDALADYEATLLEGLFGEDAEDEHAPCHDPETDGVRLDEPPDGLDAAVARIKEQLHRRIAERRFFREAIDPRRTRRRWGPVRTAAAIVGAFVGALAVILAINAFTDNDPLIPTSAAALSTVVAALIALWLLLEFAGRKLSVGRTALGHAHVEQACGFRRHLVETTPEQLRDAPDARRLSRHLAFAVALGVAEQWASTLDRLGDEAAAEMASTLGLTGGISSASVMPPGLMIALAGTTESFGHQAVVPSDPSASAGAVGGGAGPGMPGGGFGGGGGTGR